MHYYAVKLPGFEPDTKGVSVDHTPKRQNKAVPGETIRVALAARCSNLYSVLSGDAHHVVGGVNVLRRNERDWLAVCKVTRLADMQKLVAFGAGESFEEALISLNKTIAANHWKDDKPWPARGK